MMPCRTGVDNFVDAADEPPVDFAGNANNITFLTVFDLNILLTHVLCVITFTIQI